MNNSINIANTGHSKANVTGDARSTNAGAAGINSVGGNDAVDNEGPFQEFIQKANDASTQRQDKNTQISNGKNMPVSEDMSEHNDRSAFLDDSIETAELITDKHVSSIDTVMQAQRLDLDVNVDQRFSSVDAKSLHGESSQGENDLLKNKLAAGNTASTHTPSILNTAISSQHTAPEANVVDASVTGSDVLPTTDAASTRTDTGLVDESEMLLEGDFVIPMQTPLQNNTAVKNTNSETLLSPLDTAVKQSIDTKVSTSSLKDPLASSLSENTTFMSSDKTSVLSGLDAVKSDGKAIADKVMAVNKPSVNNPAVHAPLSTLEDNSENINIRELSSTVSNVLASEKINIGEAQNVLSPQLRSLLNGGVSPDGKRIHTNPVYKTDTNITSLQSGTENMLTQSSDFVRLSTQMFELMGDKAPISVVPSGQQQILSNIQSSVLPASAVPLGSSIEGTPLVSNAISSSVSTASLPAIHQAVIPEPFGRQAWPQGMGKQIMMMVNQNIGSAEIRLNPAHLGPIEILIDMSEEQVNVSLSSRHAVVREAMEQALPRLREMLDENGFNLADADISKHSFAEQREQNSEDENRHVMSANNNPVLASEISEQIIQQMTVPDGKVDYYI